MTVQVAYLFDITGSEFILDRAVDRLVCRGGGAAPTGVIGIVRQGIHLQALTSSADYARRSGAPAAIARMIRVRLLLQLLFNGAQR